MVYGAGVQSAFSTPGAARTAPRIPLPHHLLISYSHTPEVVGVYLLIGRLVLRAQAPVAVSSRDLASWLGSDTAGRTRILRAIQTLTSAGWLVSTQVGRAKATLVPTWGSATTPWTSSDARHGRPAYTRLAYVSSALVDAAFGTLHPRDTTRAPVASRTVALLTLADLGTYAVAQQLRVAPGAALCALGLLDASGRPTVSGVADFVTRAAAGDPALFFGAAGGSFAGSSGGSCAPPSALRDSVDSNAANDDQAAQTHLHHDPMIKLTNTDLPLQMISAGGNSASDLLTSSTIAQMHAALNAQQSLPAGEYHELSALAGYYGAARIAIWQARAWRAGTDQRRITPDYYHACARGEVEPGNIPRRDPSAIPSRRDPSATSGRPDLAAIPTRPDPAAAVLWRGGHAGPPAQLAAPLPPAVCAARLAAAYGQPVRAARLLRDADPALVAQWVDVAGEPGMQRWDDPLGYALTQICNQHPPPAAQVLQRWAQRVDAITLGHTVREAREARFAASQVTVQQLAAAIQLPADLGVAMHCIQYEITATRATLFCMTAIDAATEAALATALSLALAALGWPLTGDVLVIPPEPRPSRPPPASSDAGYTLPSVPVTPTASAPRPAPTWIDPDDWAALPVTARAALAGTQRGDDGVLTGGNLHALARMAPDILRRLQTTYTLAGTGSAEVQGQDAAGRHNLTDQPFGRRRTGARRHARDDRL